MTFYEWKDDFFGARLKMNEKNPQPTVPARMKVVSATTGFVTTVGRTGPCFEWFKLADGEWKSHHILQNENWLLPSEMAETERTSFRDRKERIEERKAMLKKK